MYNPEDMRLIQVSSDDGIKGRIPVQPPACASTSSYHKKVFFAELIIFLVFCSVYQSC